MDAGAVEEVVYRMLIGGIVGAKLLEVVRSPYSFLASPRLLVAVPTGTLPMIGVLAFALLCAIGKGAAFMGIRHWLRWC